MRKETFIIPDDYNFHTITRSRFGIHWGAAEEHVKIRFSAAVAKYILERKWHPSQKITHGEDGSICVALTVNHTIELKKWVLSWGKDAKILEPENLSREIRDEIKEMQALYD